LDEGSSFRLNLTLSNIRNLFVDLGETAVEIECVVNGAGVKLFQTTKGTDNEAIETLVNRGVRFAICENSLNIYQMSKDTFMEGIDFVPTGVGELVKKQVEGWVYIKP
jgi:intracellular sulfur oxidation DsrE/DsrF family protein